jgi:hypothetical protein
LRLPRARRNTPVSTEVSAIASTTSRKSRSAGTAVATPVATIPRIAAVVSWTLPIVAGKLLAAARITTTITLPNSDSPMPA